MSSKKYKQKSVFDVWEHHRGEYDAVRTLSILFLHPKLPAEAQSDMAIFHYGNDVYQSMSATQQKILSIAPKCTSPLSIVGSLYVIYLILGKDRSANIAGHNSRTYTNLLLGLCSADLITSIAYFLSTWPIPKENIYSEDIWKNIGNQTTCNSQGFMFQVGLLGSIMYTSSLSLHFLLIIRYKWLPSQVKKIDPFIHSLCILIPLGTAVVGWIKKFYNPTTFACYVQGYPTSCLLPGEPKCIRGEGVNLGLFFMLILPILLSFIFITTAMIMIYFNVYHQDQRMSRYQHGLSDENRMSRQAFWMACQYISAFCVSFTPVIFIYMIKIITGGKVGQVQFYFLLWQALLSPLQGFLNAIVYSHDLKSQLKYVRQSIASSFRNAGIERNRSFDGRQENEIASLVEQAGSTPSQAKVEQKELSIDDSAHEDRSNQKAGNITSVLQYINESEELSIDDSVHKDRNNHEAGDTTSDLQEISESV